MKKENKSRSPITENQTTCTESFEYYHATMVMLVMYRQQSRKQGFQIFFRAIVFGILLIYAIVTLPNLSSILAKIDSTHAMDRSLSSSMPLTRSLEKHQQRYEGDESIFAVGKSQLDDELKSLDRRTHDGLKIVWLMSFPNSGTSYTTKLLRHLSLTHSGSNYGSDNIGNGGAPIPIFADQPEGPFWMDPDVHPEYSFPTDYVLVKTHCGGRCTSCPPERYSETLYSFRRKCLLSTRTRKMPDGAKIYEEAPYPMDRVEKAIHVIRNPFDNIVSRFHNEIAKKNRESGTDAISSRSTPKSFREHCVVYNKRYLKEEQVSMLFNKELLELTAKVPCRADFFRFVEWHNQAFALQRDMELETLIVHSDSYTTHFNETSVKLLDFVQLPVLAEAEPFVAGKTYQEEYFTKEERQAVKEALQTLATRTTWKYMKHYFDE